MTKHYLISGLGPSHFGVGRLMSALVPRAVSRGYQVLHGPILRPAVSYVKNRDLYRIPLDVAVWALAKLLFRIRVMAVRDAEVIAIHPQIIGWALFLRLCARNRVTMYIVDNGFFCIRSYNHKNGQLEESLDCLGDVDMCDPDCTPFPVRYTRSENIRYLKEFARYAGRLNFLVQNRSQGELLERHLGHGVSWRIVGMKTDEFDEGLVVDNPDLGDPPLADVVYHGISVEVKGVCYVLEMARRLPDISFLIPDDRVRVEHIPSCGEIPDNVHFREMTWESGLREQIARCRMVICPSLWSAPIEGALIKSLLFNGNVAVYNAVLSFQAELPDGLVACLDKDLERSARTLRAALDLPADKRESNRRWIRAFIDQMDMDAIFQAPEKVELSAACRG